MGCGSSQSSHTAYKRQKQAAAYGEHSEPSTTVSSVEHRSAEPEERECEDILHDANGLPQPRPHHKPQAEFWAHPPSSSPPQTHSTRPANKTSASRGPEPTEHPGHTLHDTRKRPAKEQMERCQHFIKAEER